MKVEGGEEDTIGHRNERLNGSRRLENCSCRVEGWETMKM